MKRVLLVLFILLTLAAIALGSVGAWYVYTKQPVRSGTVALRNLQGAVSVQYDERGVPHIRAANEADLYRALGYVHAQDRLFQMEIVRRLAQGELAEILGPKLLDTDKLFRTLGIRAKAQAFEASMDANSPASQTLLAYLDGINQAPLHPQRLRRRHRLPGLQFCGGPQDRASAHPSARQAGGGIHEGV